MTYLQSVTLEAVYAVGEWERTLPCNHEVPGSIPSGDILGSDPPLNCRSCP